MPPPSALPRVEVTMSTRSSTPCSWRASAAWARSRWHGNRQPSRVRRTVGDLADRPRSATKPSIENTPSVTISTWPGLSRLLRLAVEVGEVAGLVAVADEAHAVDD